MRTSTKACVVVGVLLILGCHRDRGREDLSDRTSTTQITSGDMPVGVPQSSERVGVTVRDGRSRADFVHVARADLKNADLRLDGLERGADGILDPAKRAQMEDQIRSARAAMRALHQRVATMEQVSDDTWMNEQTHLQADWELLNARLERIGDEVFAHP